jgi:hypothetical protein
MPAQLHTTAGAVSVDGSAAEAAQRLEQTGGERHAEFRAKGKTVFVNPSAVAYIEEVGEARDANLGDT